MPEVHRDIPRHSDGTAATMWNLIPKLKMPPTRRIRYCCGILKESAGFGHLNITGVRWAESNRRRNIWRSLNINGSGVTKKAAQLGIQDSGDDEKRKKNRLLFDIAEYGGGRATYTHYLE